MWLAISRLGNQSEHMDRYPPFVFLFTNQPFASLQKLQVLGKMCPKRANNLSMTLFLRDFVLKMEMLLSSRFTITLEGILSSWITCHKSLSPLWINYVSIKHYPNCMRLKNCQKRDFFQKIWNNLFCILYCQSGIQMDAPDPLPITYFLIDAYDSH